ncbi:hypothetical protein B7494_g6791 [Chlorociboria aeruginascens]|nr:hypothetical protein B7494_g6791 [Chlorociboria aeruginascens]
MVRPFKPLQHVCSRICTRRSHLSRLKKNVCSDSLRVCLSPLFPPALCPPSTAPSSYHSAKLALDRFNCQHKHLQRLISPRCHNPELCTGDAITTHSECRHWMCGDCIEFDRIGFLNQKFGGQQNCSGEAGSDAGGGRGGNMMEWGAGRVGSDTEGDQEEALQMDEQPRKLGEGERENIAVGWEMKNEMKYNTRITNFEIGDDEGYGDDMGVKWDGEGKEAGTGREQEDHKYEEGHD